MMFNAGMQDCEFEFPVSFPNSNWWLAFDTALGTTQEDNVAGKDKPGDSTTSHLLRASASVIWVRSRR
jgi:hypothetical protein